VTTAAERIEFAKSDDADLSETQAELEAAATRLMGEVAEYDKVFRETGMRDPRTAGAEAKARRQLEAVQPQLDAIRRETEARRVDTLNRVGAEAREAKLVRKMREEGLAHWTAEQRRLRSLLDDSKTSGFVNITELQAADKAVQEIRAWIEKDPNPTKERAQTRPRPHRIRHVHPPRRQRRRGPLAREERHAEERPRQAARPRGRS
jgi:hypothetical protein